MFLRYHHIEWGDFMNGEILNILEKAEKLLDASNMCNDFATKIKQLKGKIQNKQIVISVVGQFKRGKTSFINTILGNDILPVGIIPITSVITKLRYGLPQAKIMFNNGEEKEVSFDSLHKYISEQENPKNKKDVECVDIYYPCGILKDGVILVDTPGVGSIHKHNTEVTYSFLKDSDAVIFMLSVDSPINEIEKDFLYSVRKYASKFYFAVNKIDMISEKELEIFLKYCEKVLCETMNVDSVVIFPISAKDSTGIEEILSCIKADIQTSIEDILIESVKIKTKDILNNALSRIDLYISASKIPLDDLESKVKELTEKLKDLDKINEEVFYRTKMSCDSLVQNIENILVEESKKIINETELMLKNIYEQNINEKPKKLEKELKKIVETDLDKSLEKMNNEGLSSLELNYKNMIDIFNNNIDIIKAFISEKLYEIFNVKYNYEKTEYTLSGKEDFYVDTNNEPIAFFINMNNFIYFMPKRYANKSIYNNYLDKMKDIVERNKNNMLYNYKYKINESLRAFNFTFNDELEILKNEVKNILNKVISIKENKREEIIEELKLLSNVYEELNNILESL